MYFLRFRCASETYFFRRPNCTIVLMFWGFWKTGPVPRHALCGPMDLSQVQQHTNMTVEREFGNQAYQYYKRAQGYKVQKLADWTPRKHEVFNTIEDFFAAYSKWAETVLKEGETLDTIRLYDDYISTQPPLRHGTNQESAGAANAAGTPMGARTRGRQEDMGPRRQRPHYPIRTQRSPTRKTCTQSQEHLTPFHLASHAQS